MYWRRSLGEVYPGAVAKLVDLFTRVAANDAQLSRLHQARPSGAGLHLAGAELVARGLESFLCRDELSITKELQLPDWTYSAKMSWPVGQRRWRCSPWCRRRRTLVPTGGN